jgi:hypothetical protein
MYNKYLITDFMLLPQYSIFGDYQILSDIKSNIVFKTAKYGKHTRFMCVSKKVLMNLCDLFPVTGKNLKERGLHKRMFYLKAMMRLDNNPNTKYRALLRPEHKNLNNPKPIVLAKDPEPAHSFFRQDLIEELADSVYPLQNTKEKGPTEKLPASTTTVSGDSHLPTFDEKYLEAFFSDEYDNGVVSNSEDVESVMKRVGRKADTMIEAIKLCQKRMKANNSVVQQYINEKKMPNADFVRQIEPVAREYIRLADVKHEKIDAQQLYGVEQGEWRKQWDQINEIKKSKEEDMDEKIRRKEDAEKVIARALANRRVAK